MSLEKTTGPCNKFQANIFNKTKCQNCFKSRELHLLNEHDLEQAKPIYAGWLCLAPVGTDFDNLMQRSRKWQRRFFILYEHGSLSFALDEQLSTLPQGTVNMSQCTDITDAEPRTGQRNALCIITLEQEIFIRGDNKEIINGWSEQLAVYLRTNKQNQKKKRKVEPISTQEPSPAKMAATDPIFPSSKNAAVSDCVHWQEDHQGRGPGVNPTWTVADTVPPGPEQIPAGNSSTYLFPVSRDSIVCPVGSLDLVTAGNIINQLAESNTTSAHNNQNQSQDKSPSEKLLGFKASKKEQEGTTAVSRTGRSEARTSRQEKLQSCGDMNHLAAPPPQRRARSLDRRTSDTVMTQDVLNFKKGWMIKLDESEQWKKYWFVLSTDSLRYYKDSVAEEALDLEGEIDLTRCYNVSEYQVQRNYGFQIQNPKGVYTLSAMTSGIRKNWIQALMKKVHQANAPDVASLPAHHGPCCPPEALPKPDVTQDSPISGGSTDFHPKHRTVMERRREGRYRTFDWAEFRPQNRPTVDTDPDRSKALCSLELGDLERRKRREERRRRYESMLGISLSWENGGKAVDVSMRALSPNSQQNVEEEMEECWKLVEKTVFRMGRSVPLFTAAKDMQTENLLDSYRKEVEHLKALLADSDRCRLELEAQLRTEGYYWPQLDSSLSSETDINPKGKPLNGHTPTLKDTHKEIREVMKHPSLQVQPSFEPPPLRHQAPSILLRDTDGKLQEGSEALPPESDAAPLLSPASGNQDLLFQSDGEANHGTELDREDHQQKETQLECRPLILENPSEGDGELLNCFVENHIPPDETLVRKLSQMLELLTSQNDALNQRNQELVNQLTEADREIERLKAELSRRHSEPHHLPEVEQRQAVEDLEKELNLRNQQLLEAQTLISSLQENLRETDLLLQLNIRTETEETGQEKSAEKAEEYLHLCLEEREAKLTELEKQLDQSKTTCRELQTQNADLKEAEELNRQTAAEAEAEVRRLSQELEKEKEKERVRDKKSSGEERIQQVIEGMIMRLNILGKLLEVIDILDVGLRKNEEDENTSQLKWEKEFWRSLHSKLNPSQTKEENSVEVLLGEVTEQMLVERELLLLGNDLLSETDEGRDEKTDESSILDFNYQPCEIKQFRDGTQMKISSLNRLASVSTSACEKLQLMADKLSQGLPWSAFLHSAATEALYCYQLSRLQAKYDRELEESKQNLYSSSLICNKCLALMEENREMRARLSNLEEQQKTMSYCQTEETHPQVTEPGTVDGIQKENLHYPPETPEEEMIESLDSDCMEVQLCADGQLETQETEDDNKMESDASHEDANSKEEEVLFLKRRVTELEEQLSIMEEEMKEEFDVKIRGFQCQHEKDIEKLKVTCERGFLSMEESHVKVVEELQRRYQQEVERLLVDRDRLLEEESAATATAIEAIEKAHRLELEREVQRRCQSERNTGNAHLDDIYRQHSEELTSHQRELQVLSQQFSLKCLENGHLVQALDAERKALCQCQKENQDLRTRNQELSGHLAAEITRLCSLAKQDKSLLAQGMDVYEMEITLRVKESEVQCLKQEIASLKDELQAVQRDKRNATKKYKDMCTELSIIRAKTEREMDDLRENLRLAHRALDQTSP